MTKIAVLLPKETMARDARTLLLDMTFDVVACKAITTANTVNEARYAISLGAEIFIARGYQAKIMKRFTEIPVVEIMLSMQEIGLLIMKAKKYPANHTLTSF